MKFHIQFGSDGSRILLYSFRNSFVVFKETDILSFLKQETMFAIVGEIGTMCVDEYAVLFSVILTNLVTKVSK